MTLFSVPNFRGFDNAGAIMNVDDTLMCSFKVGMSGYGSLQTMSTDKWATSKSTQLSTKVWVKLLLLLENALKLDQFEAL